MPQSAYFYAFAFHVFQSIQFKRQNFKPTEIDAYETAGNFLIKLTN